MVCCFILGLFFSIEETLHVIQASRAFSTRSDLPTPRFSRRTHSLAGGRRVVGPRLLRDYPPLPPRSFRLFPPPPFLPSCLLPSLSVGHKRPVCPRDVAPAAPASASASPSVRMSVGGRGCEGENSALCDGRHVTILI